MRYTAAGAILSGCAQFRYRLWRRWDNGRSGRVLPWIMLNPSKADGEQDDPTIRKCVGFADRMGYEGIEVVNLFAYRATDPAELKAVTSPVGPENDAHIRAVLTIYPGNVICAWGANAATRLGWARVRQVVDMLRDAGAAEPMALRVTRNGVPHHPLMLPYSCQPQPFNSTTMQGRP